MSFKIKGINLDGPKDYSNQKMFADAMLMRRSWSPIDQGPWGELDTVPTDSDGWPLTDGNVRVFGDLTNADGIYKFSCIGRCQLTALVSTFKIENLFYDPTLNKTTADINVPVGSGGVNFKITGTAGGIKNVKLMLPGHAESEIFNKAFLASLKPFNLIRFMDAFHTNGNTNTTWDKRTLPQKDQSTVNGIAIEHAIDLCNQSGCDGWFNVPHMADENYIREMAKLIQKRLDPKRRIYLEYSNEVWNSIFPQWKWNVDQAQADQKLGVGKYDYDQSTNIYFWGWRRTAYMAIRLSQIFAEVFGLAAVNDKVRVILAMQIGYGTLEAKNEFYQYIQAMKYIQSVWGEPKSFIYAMSGAPYYGAAAAVREKVGLTAPELLTEMLRSSTGSKDKLTRMGVLANAWGLKNINYEGGVDLAQTGVNQDVKIAANNDPQMEKVSSSYGDTMMSTTDGHCYFALCGVWTKYGFWGLGQEIKTIADSPKYKGWVAAMAKYPDVELPPGKAPEPPAVTKADVISWIENAQVSINKVLTWVKS